MSPPTDCPKCDGEVARSQLNVLLLQQRSAFTFLFVCTFLSFSAGAGNASEKKQPQTKNLLPTDPIPRYHWQSTEALALIGASRPVILVGTGLTGVATNRWTDEYLLKFWEDGPDSSPIRGAMTSTLKTQDGRPLFYYTHRDEVGWYNTGQFKINEREMMYNYTTVPQFLQRRQTESRGAEEDYGQYVQTPIFGRGGRPGRFGEQIVNDLDSFDWSVVEYLKDHFGWWQDGIGGTENTLWLGDPGAGPCCCLFDSTLPLALWLSFLSSPRFIGFPIFLAVQKFTNFQLHIHTTVVFVGPPPNPFPLIYLAQ